MQYSYSVTFYVFGCVSVVASAIHKQLLIPKHKAAAVRGGKKKKEEACCGFCSNVNVWSLYEVEMLFLYWSGSSYRQLVPWREVGRSGASSSGFNSSYQATKIVWHCTGKRHGIASVKSVPIYWYTHLPRSYILLLLKVISVFIQFHLVIKWHVIIKYLPQSELGDKRSAVSYVFIMLHLFCS